MTFGESIMFWHNMRGVRLVVLFMIFPLAVISLLSGCDQKPSVISTCYQHGYTGARYSEGTYYCIRSVLGTDEIVPLEKMLSKVGAK